MSIYNINVEILDAVLTHLSISTSLELNVSMSPIPRVHDKITEQPCTFGKGADVNYDPASDPAWSAVLEQRKADKKATKKKKRLRLKSKTKRERSIDNDNEAYDSHLSEDYYDDDDDWAVSMDSGPDALHELPASQRSRRGYRGVRGKVTIFTGSSLSWVKSYNDFAANHLQKCAEVHARYEKRLNRFGYSLLDMKQHVPSSFVAPWLVPNLTFEPFH